MTDARDRLAAPSPAYGERPPLPADHASAPADGFAPADVRTKANLRARADVLADADVIADADLNALLQHAADAAPEQLAVPQRDWTYAELLGRVERLAGGLARIGVAPGERVAIHLSPGPELAVAYFAALRVGAVVVPSDPAASGAALEHSWNDAGVAAVIVDALAYEREVVANRPRLPARDYVVVPRDAAVEARRGWPSWLERTVERLRGGPAAHASAQAPAVHRFDALMRGPARAAAPARVDAGAIAAIHYTSPLTGIAKGAIHSHGSVMAAATQLGACMPEAAPEAFGVAQYAAHGFELTAGLLLPLARAATIVWFDPALAGATLVAVLAQQRVTTLVAEPEVVARLLEVSTEPAALPHLRACICSWGLEEPLRARWREQCGRVALLECFGAGEAAFVTHVRGLAAADPTALGEPVPGLEVRVLDPTDRRTPCARGQLWVRGAQVMRGYWGRPDPTQALLQGGWLDTGERVEVDGAGGLGLIDAATAARERPGAGRV